MAGITYAQVAAAADELLVDKKDISIVIIRNVLGTGSHNTIHKHLKTWRAGLTAPAAATYKISSAVTNALLSDLAACAAESRMEIEKKLSQAETDLAALASAGELLETQRDDLEQQVTALTTERDGIAGKSRHQEAEIASLSERLDRSQAAAQQSKINLAMAEVKLTDLQQRDASHKEAIQAKVEALEEESKARTAENKARTIAEQQVAVLNAKQESSQALMASTSSRVDTLTKELTDCTAELQAVRAQLLRQQEVAALTQRESADAIQQAQKSSLQAQEATTAAKHAQREADMLRGRLDAMQEIAKDAKALA